MKKRIVAIACMLAILLGMLALTSGAANYSCYIGSTGYSKLADAVEKYNTGYIKLNMEIGTQAAKVTVTKDTYIDLNGYNLLCAIEIQSGATLYLMDSQTDDFSVAADATTGLTYGTFSTANVTGSGKFAAVPAISGVTEHNDGYVMLGDSANGFTFHRFTFNTTATSPFVTCSVAYDSVVGAAISQYGVAMSTAANPTKDNNTVYSATPGAKAVNTKFKVSMAPVILSSEEHLTNVYRSQADINVYARPYYILNGVTVYGDQIQTVCNLKADVEELSANWNTASLWEKYGAYQLLMDNADMMRYWKVSNIRQSGLCPDNWTDVVSKAKSDGKVHYYFMYSDNTITGGTERVDGGEYKWGDSCLIVFPDGTTMMIDTGRYEYLPTLVKNLRRMGITKIDYLVISHGDGDHIGGALNAKGVTNTHDGGIVEYFEVGTVYYPGNTENTVGTYKNLARYFNAKKANWKNANMQLVPVLAGDTRYPIGTSATMQVLWPDATGIPGSTADPDPQNENSMVIRIDCGEHSSLFTGDIYRADTGDYDAGAEGKLIELYGSTGELDVDLLKAPHHGQNTSNSYDFLDAVTPILAVATGNVSDVEYLVDGAKNPTVHVNTRYNNREISLYRDFNYGYIHVVASGDTVDVEIHPSNPE